MKQSLIAVLLAATCAFSTTASAAWTPMTGTSGADLSSGSYNATYSGKSYLPENYTVNGLTFSFSFLDAGGTFTDSAPVRNSYSATKYAYHSHDARSLTWARYVDIKQTITRSSQQETAQLSIGDIVLGSGATTFSEEKLDGGSTFNRIHDQAWCIAIWCKYLDSKITTKTKIIKQDYTGGFTISGNITNQSIIDQLLATGDLTFNLNIGGNLQLSNAQVLIDYSEVKAPAEVPEPSGVLLVAAGLAGLGLVRRRRNAASAAPRSA